MFDYPQNKHQEEGVEQSWGNLRQIKNAFLSPDKIVHWNSVLFYLAFTVLESKGEILYSSVSDKTGEGKEEIILPLKPISMKRKKCS